MRAEQNACTCNWAPHFLGIWKGILAAVLGWSEDETIQWAAKFEEFMQDPNDIFFHKPPQYWLTNVLIPDTLKKRVNSFELIDLQSRIVEAFGNDAVYDMPVDTNWEPYRERIEKLLSEYGERLP